MMVLEFMQTRLMPHLLWKAMMNLPEIKQSIRALSLKEARALDRWLHTLIERNKSKMRARPTTAQHDALDTHRVVHKTYRRELVRCGKESCQCRNGKLHGPYWYAYWAENGKTKSQYIGKYLPQEHPARHLQT